MTRTVSIAFAFSVWTLSGALTGCTAHVTGLHQSDSFTHGNIDKGGMAVGGMSSSTDELRASEAKALANMLRRELRDERPGFKVTTVNSVRRKLGKRRYASLMAELAGDHGLSQRWYGVLKRALKVRYVVFGRVEADEIDHHRTERQQTNYKGELIRDKYVVTSTTDRDVTIEFTVLDLDEGNIGWSGSITQSRRASSDYTKTDNALVALVKVAASVDDNPDRQYPFPRPPRFKRVAESVFFGFAQNMPEAP